MPRGLFRGCDGSSSNSHVDSSLRGLSEHEEYDDDETQPASPSPSRVENNEVGSEAEQIVVPDVEEIAADGRIILYISRAGYLSPTFRVRSAATDSFQLYQEDDGYCWKNVSEKQKDNYFKDLKKTCTWDEEKLPTEIVRQHWDTVAPKAYSDFVCRVKKAVGTPKENKFVKSATLTKWKEYWARPEVIAKSEIARRNRNSEVNGPGTGPAIHHGGSRNAELHARDLAIANGVPIDSTSLPTTLRFHCKNGVWTDTRAKKKYDEVQLRFAEERAPLPGTNEERVLTKEREQEIWAEVFEANDRGRVIGQGCLSRLYVKRRKRVSQISCTPLQTQQEARIRELEERLKAQEEERKAQEEERKVQEELRAAKEAKRDEDYEMLKREVLKFGAIFKSLPEGFSSQFDSSSSALH